MSKLIEVKNVTKSFKNSIVFDDVSIDFGKGISHAVIGYNGCGKSVFLKMLCGFSKPDKGTIAVNGKVIGRDIDFIENTGVVINAPDFINHLTGFENLKYISEFKNIIDSEKINDVLELLDLSDAKNKKYKTYSQGMKQRLRIAQAIMESPDILILDEPMNALDKKGVELVRDILLKHVESGKTLIFTSHNKEDISLLAEKVYEIDDKSIKEISASLN